MIFLQILIVIFSITINSIIVNNDLGVTSLLQFLYFVEKKIIYD